MAQEFFYNIPLVDFKPGTPDVDLNFLKSLADDYRATVDKADAAKEDIINKLGSLNLHQTFSNDYADYMKNVEKQISDLDSKYQGKMIDRNYKNELSTLVRNIQNDPNLRYMANTSKELFTYEEMKRTSQDYLEYNDPMISGYQAVLNRAKGTRPSFTATNIYKDTNPVEQLRTIAKDISITENTTYVYDNELGTVETIDSKTRTKTDITNKMQPMMQSFRATQAGQQIEREAAWRKKPDGSAYTYEELFIEKINGISESLTVESFKKSLSVSPAEQVALQRKQVDLEALKLLQDADQFNKSYNHMIKQAKNDDIYKLMQLQKDYAALGYDVMKFNAQILYQYQTKGMEAALDLMGKQLKGVQDGAYIPGLGNAGGGGSGKYNPIDVTRFTSSGMSAVTADLPTYSQLDNLQANKSKLDEEIITGKNKLVSYYGKDNMTKIDAYLAALDTGDAENYDSEITLTVAGTPITKKISEAILLNKELYDYQENYIQAKALGNTYDAVLFKSSQSFYNAISANDQLVTDLINAGAFVPQSAQNSPYTTNTYRNNFAGVDEAKLLAYYGADINRLRSKATVVVGRAAPLDYSPSAIEITKPYEEVLAAVTNNTILRYTDPVDGTVVTVTPDQAKIYLDRADAQIMNTIYSKNSVLKRWKEYKDQAIADVYGKQGTMVRGYKMLPTGSGDLSELDKQYALSLTTNLGGLKVYDVNTGYRYMYSQGKGLQRITSTGEGTGDYFNHIEPNIVYLDPLGRLVIQANAYPIDPAKAKPGDPVPSTAVTIVDEPSNIKTAFLDPLFARTYGPTIGPAISAIFEQKSKWVMNRLGNLPNGQATVVQYKQGISITKNVDNSYTVQNADGATLVGKNEFQLAEILARLDYKSTRGASVAVPELGEVPQLEVPTLKSIGDLIEDYNDIAAGIPKDVTTTTTNGTSTTTTTGNNQFIKDYILKNIFHTAVKQKESGGNYGAVNDSPVKMPDGTVRQPTYASGAFQFVPSVWNDQIRIWAKEYGKPNADDYDIYDPRQPKKEGPARQDFLNDQAFQNFCMQKATDLYINSYDKKVPAEAKTIFSLPEYTVLAHSIGEPTATAYAKLKAGLITEDQLTEQQKQLIIIGEEYLSDIDNRLSKTVTPKPSKPVDVGAVATDILLKGMAPGDTTVLADGTTYTKTEPVGVPNPSIQKWSDLPDNEVITSYAHKSQLISEYSDMLHKIFDAEIAAEPGSPWYEAENAFLNMHIDHLTKKLSNNDITVDRAKSYMKISNDEFILNGDERVYTGMLKLAYGDNMEKIENFSTKLSALDIVYYDTFDEIDTSGLSDTESSVIDSIFYTLSEYKERFDDIFVGSTYKISAYDQANLKAIGLGVTTLIDNLGGSLDDVIKNMKRSKGDDYALEVLKVVDALSPQKVLRGFDRTTQR